jgi:hypothetical protein
MHQCLFPCLASAASCCPSFTQRLSAPSSAPDVLYGTLYGRAHRRCSGFGQPSISRSSSHDTVAPALIGHFIWPWLTVHDRHALTIAIPPYAALCLRLPGPSSTCCASHGTTQITPPSRYTSALIALDFDYGDLIRWLGGEYTAAHRDRDTTFAALDNLRDLPTPQGYPSI